MLPVGPFDIAPFEALVILAVVMIVFGVKPTRSAKEPAKGLQGLVTLRIAIIR
jgi:hypothetical protein